jgi:hypothetical protein
VDGRCSSDQAVQDDVAPTQEVGSPTPQADGSD